MGRLIYTALAAAIALLPATAFAQAGGAFRADARTGCKVWWLIDDISTTTLKSVTWNGPCAGGLAKGHGTFEIVASWQYKERGPSLTTWTGEGDFVGGKLNGRAFYNYDRGYQVSAGAGRGRVEGEFRDGLRDGKVIENEQQRREDGKDEGSTSKLECQYVQGKRNGYCVEDYKRPWDEGKIEVLHFEYEYQDSRPIRGRYTKTIQGCGQESYEGEFGSTGLFEGRGTLKSFDGKVYTGVWQAGYLNGRWAMDLSSAATTCLKWR